MLLLLQLGRKVLPWLKWSLVMLSCVKLLNGEMSVKCIVLLQCGVWPVMKAELLTASIVVFRFLSAVLTVLLLSGKLLCILVTLSIAS